MPELQESLDSVRVCAAWIYQAMASEIISSSQSRELVSACRLVQANIKIREGLHEIENLRQLVARQEQAALQVRQAEIASRKTGGDDVSEYDAELEPGTN